MADVIRVAVGEVEDFARVHLIAIDPVDVRGTAAVDIAHLLSELMENGTQYSAPDRRVEVVGHSTNDGGYVVSISDEGMGMSAEAVAEANLQLARPPIIGLSLSRSLGFIVAGTLAARHRVKVSLTDSPSGGITALVALPPGLLVRHDGYDPDLPPSGISEHAVPATVAGFIPSVHAVPASEPDWLQAAPEFDADEPLRASFEVSDQAEPDGWVPTEDQAAERQIDPLRAFHLEGDPFADFAAEPAPEQAPIAPVGAAFEAGIVSMIAGTDQPRPRRRTR